MRDLVTLQSDPVGRHLLERRGVYDDPDIFLRHLRPPRIQNKASRGAGHLPVYASQQVYLDYRSSVVAKLQVLRDLPERSPDIRPEFIWIDTDRAASDSLAMRIYLPRNNRPEPLKLAPSRSDRIETRFIQIDPARVHNAMKRMEEWVRQMPGDRGANLARYERLRASLKLDGTLADLGRGISDLIIAETLSFRPRPVNVSSLIAAGALVRVLEKILNRQRDFVAGVNARIEELQAADIAPQLKPLAEDYLPLFMTCPEDGSRLRLRLVQEGKDNFAIASKRSGGPCRYDLGRGVLSMDHIKETRWSPDVTLLLLVNDYYSGMVAGKSSALYMLVFHDVMRKVLDLDPIPILVPSHWDVFPNGFDGLLNAYLTGQRL